MINTTLYGVPLTLSQLIVKTPHQSDYYNNKYYKYPRANEIIWNSDGDYVFSIPINLTECKSNEKYFVKAYGV